MFSEIYANIAIVARKNSGKTYVISNILNECAGRDTKVIIFCSTVYKDKAWISIRENLEKKGIETECHTSLFDTESVSKSKKGIDRLKALVDELTLQSEPVSEEEIKQSGGGALILPTT